MSSILRFSRALSSLKNVANVIKPSVTVSARRVFLPSNINGLIAMPSTRWFGVQPSTQRNVPDRQPGLDRVLMKLDNEVIRTGRLSAKVLDDLLLRLPGYNTISSTQALLLLRCCGPFVPEEPPAARTEKALKVWQLLQAKGVALDLSHYNALLRLYVENDHDFSPLDYLAQLEKEGTSPNRVTYQRLIHRFCMLGDIEGASKILEFMKTEQMSITGSVFHSLMLGHSRANDLASAVDTLELMSKSGHEPTVEAFCALAVAQAEHGDIDGVSATIAKSRDSDQPMSDEHLLEVIFALAVKGHQEHVPKILNSVRKEMYYNKDCKNMIYRLLNEGQDDVAQQLHLSMTILSDTDSQSHMNTGLFYLKHLVKCNRPIDTILERAREMETQNAYILEHLLESALLYNSAHALPLMDAVVGMNHPLRPHYFWPLFKRADRENDLEGVYDVVQQMVTRSVPVSNQTVSEYVIPSLVRQDQSMEAMATTLRKCGVTMFTIVNGLVRYYLSRNDLEQAVRTLSTYSNWLTVGMYRQLISAVIFTKDYQNAAIILGQIRPRNDQVNREAPSEVEGEEATAGETHWSEDVVGRFLVDLAGRVDGGSGERSVDFEALLQSIIDRGLSMTPHNASEFLRRVRSASPAVEQLVATLSSGTLERVDIERSQRVIGHKRSISELEESLEVYKSKGLDTKGLLIMLLGQYCRDGQVDKAEESLKVLETDHEFSLGIGLQVLLFNMYCDAGLLSQAQKAFQDCLETSPDKGLQPSKFLGLAHLLVQNDKLDEALEILAKGGSQQQEQTDDPDQERTPHYLESMQCQTLLQSIAEKGDVSGVQRVTAMLINNGYSAGTARLLGSSVRVHLVKNDMDGAFEALTSIMEEHNVLPLKRVLMKQLIEQEDTDRLQKLMDMSTKLFGEANSLLDLALAFIEIDKIKQARKIVQTPGFRVAYRRVHDAFETYLRTDKIECMEALLDVSASMYGLDRRPLFHYVLKAYEKTGNAEKASELWTRMQEENVTAGDAFLHELGSFLERSGQSVPFAIPPGPVAPSPSLATINRPKATPTPKPAPRDPAPPKVIEPAIVKFRDAIAADQLEEALSLYNSNQQDSDVPKYQIDTLKMIEKLADADRLDEAADIFKSNLNNWNWSTRSITGFFHVRRLLSRLAEKGDVDTLMSIINKMPQESSHQRGQFVRFLCIAAGETGNTDQVMSIHRSWLNDVTPDNVENHKRNFSKIGFLHMLNKNPSVLPQVETLAEEYKAKGLMQGVSTLWGYHFYNKNTEKSNELLKELSQSHDTLPHLALCDTMRFTKDVSVAPGLIQQLHDNPSLAAPFAAATVYGCWIDVLRLNGKPEEGLQVLETAVKHVSLETIRSHLLNNLKTDLEAKNINFPYTIPAVKSKRKRAQQSSSSSSDSD